MNLSITIATFQIGVITPTKKNYCENYGTLIYYGKNYETIPKTTEL